MGTHRFGYGRDVVPMGLFGFGYWLDFQDSGSGYDRGVPRDTRPIAIPTPYSLLSFSLSFFPPLRSTSLLPIHVQPSSEKRKTLPVQSLLQPKRLRLSSNPSAAAAVRWPPPSPSPAASPEGREGGPEPILPFRRAAPKLREFVAERALSFIAAEKFIAKFFCVVGIRRRGRTMKDLLTH